MLHPDHMSAEGLPMTVRTVYVLNPEKVLKLALTYPASTGRNFDEVGDGKWNATKYFQSTGYRKVNI